jgi:nucleoside-diphosphate-sugar epimerase
VGEWTYNEEAVRVAEDEGISVEEKGIRPFMASRVLVEKKVWEWVASEKPGFRFNSVLPDFVMGPILEPEKQSASTAGFVRGLWEGDGRAIATVRHIEPQWFIDARDNGRLFVAALVSPGVEGERVFGCAGRFSFPEVVEILRREFPGKEGLPDLEDVGEDMTVVLPRKRALELLRSVGQEEWTPLVQSVRDLVESFGGK